MRFEGDVSSIIVDEIVRFVSNSCLELESISSVLEQTKTKTEVQKNFVGCTLYKVMSSLQQQSKEELFIEVKFKQIKDRVKQSVAGERKTPPPFASKPQSNIDHSSHWILLRNRNKIRKMFGICPGKHLNKKPTLGISYESREFLRIITNHKQKSRLSFMCLSSESVETVRIYRNHNTFG